MYCLVNIDWEALSNQTEEFFDFLRTKPWKNVTVRHQHPEFGRNPADEETPVQDRFPMRWMSDLMPGEREQEASSGIDMYMIDHYDSVVPFFCDLAMRFSNLSMTLKGSFDRDPENEKQGCGA